MAHVPSIDLAQYFADQTAHTWGTDVFAGRLPDTPHEAIAFSDQGGVGPLNVFGWTGPRRPTLQVLLRASATQYVRSRELVDEVFSTLHCRAQITAGGNSYMAIDAQQEPIWLGYDDSERPMWSLNFTVMYENPLEPVAASIGAVTSLSGSLTVVF